MPPSASAESGLTYPAFRAQLASRNCSAHTLHRLLSPQHPEGKLAKKYEIEARWVEKLITVEDLLRLLEDRLELDPDEDEPASLAQLDHIKRCLDDAQELVDERRQATPEARSMFIVSTSAGTGEKKDAVPFGESSSATFGPARPRLPEAARLTEDALPPVERQAIQEILRVFAQLHRNEFATLLRSLGRGSLIPDNFQSHLRLPEGRIDALMEALPRQGREQTLRLWRLWFRSKLETIPGLRVNVLRHVADVVNDERFFDPKLSRLNAKLTELADTM